MMWMTGYNDGGDFDSIQDPFTSGTKLRPLMSRQSAASNPPCFSSIHGADFLALNHHLAAMAEQNKRELSTTQQVVVGTRWNPTLEQLHTLEEMYRRGTRTPSADQIQQITSHLRRYGKIEGKNVFYWFQNHKARERQKRRCQLESLSDEQTHHSNHQTENIKKRQEPPGANRRAIEVEQTKNWASLTNLSSTTTPEKTAKRAADGWLHLDEDADMSQQRRNATWHMKHLSCSSSSPTINSAAASVNTCSATAIPSQEMQQHHHHQDSINIVLEPYYSPRRQNLDVYSAHHHSGGTAVVQTQILQLFPLQSSGGRRQEEEEEEAESGAAADSVTPSYQFYEFLQLKN